MKKRGFDSTTTALWVLIFVMIVLAVAIVFVNVCLQSESDMKETLLDSLNSLISAVIVGVIGTMFTKIIVDNLAKVKRNNDKLKEFGTEYIGTGESTKKDVLHLFGNKYINEYPKEIKLMFISGNIFINKFKKELLNCLQQSDCIVKILLISTDPLNQEYAKRMEKICPQKEPYHCQVNNKSINVLKSIANQLNDSNKRSQLKLRFYRDEYRYNFRIAKYCSGDNIAGKCWINVQPLNRDAVEVSIGLYGEWNNETSSDNNIYELLDEAFDKLWDEYEQTEYTL